MPRTNGVGTADVGFSTAHIVSEATHESSLSIADEKNPSKQGQLPIQMAALALICLMLAVGAYLSFPLFDDAWLVLIMRESGRYAITQTTLDRPVFGFLMQGIVSLGGANRLLFVLINAIVWLIFAIEAALLFRKLFPEFKRYSIVAACLTLAPIVIQTQLSTVNVVLPANLPTVLSYAGILILLRDSDVKKPNGGLFLTLAAALMVSGIAISEYGVAANLAGIVLLIGAASMVGAGAARRRLLVSAGWVLPVTLITYVVFTKIADLGARPSVDPSHVLQSVLSKWMEVPFDIVAGTWRATIAAYATALSTITIAWDSKSTIIAAFVGLLMASLLCLGTRARSTEIPSEDRREQISRRVAFLLLAILAGLAPVRLMGRTTTLVEFGSRFLIPIMPAAAAVTLALALRLVGKRFRWVPVAAFGLIIGYATWTFTYTTFQRHRTVAALGMLLQPYVAKSDGYTVVIAPFERFESELTATVAANWHPEMEQKLWVLSESAGRAQFGNRGTCHPSDVLDAENRKVVRRGRLDRLLWVEVRSGKPATVEQYCLFTN